MLLLSRIPEQEGRKTFLTAITCVPLASHVGIGAHFTLSQSLPGSGFEMQLGSMRAWCVRARMHVCVHAPPHTCACACFHVRSAP